MEESNVIENITKSIGVRLRVPIIITYISVLIIYNWDILFYLFFEKISASEKIKVIKETYSDNYYDRLLSCLVIAIGAILLFTIINTILNFCLKWFYRKDKEIKSEINNHEKVVLLTNQLSESIDKNKLLNSEIDNLKNINQSLSVKNLNLDTSDISQKDYEDLIVYLNSQNQKEKYLYCLKELLNSLKKNLNTTKDKLIESSTYPDEIQVLLEILEEKKLAKVEHSYRGDGYGYFLNLSKSFKDFLKMEI
jgi:hypothetical protein